MFLKRKGNSANEHRFLVANLLFLFGWLVEPAVGSRRQHNSSASSGVVLVVAAAAAATAARSQPQGLRLATGLDTDHPFLQIGKHSATGSQSIRNFHSIPSLHRISSI